MERQNPALLIVMVLCGAPGPSPENQLHHQSSRAFSSRNPRTHSLAAGSVPAMGCRAWRRMARGRCAVLAGLFLLAATREDDHVPRFRCRGIFLRRPASAAGVPSSEFRVARDNRVVGTGSNGESGRDDFVPVRPGARFPALLPEDRPFRWRACGLSRPGPVRAGGHMRRGGCAAAPGAGHAHLGAARAGSLRGAGGDLPAPCAAVVSSWPLAR